MPVQYEVQSLSKVMKSRFLDLIQYENNLQ